MKTYLLKYLATWLADNRKDIIDRLIREIKNADTRFNSGAVKFTFVRGIASELLSKKADWLVDTVIHLLLAWIRKGAEK